MSSSLDALFTYLRGTLQDPPAIVRDAEREVEALRAECERLRMAASATRVLYPSEQDRRPLLYDCFTWTDLVKR